VAVLGALALAALALLLWRQLAPRPYAPPDASQLALGDATRLLRRDDLASREGALKALQALVTDQPQYVQARAEQVVALAFHLDDLRVMLAEDADARRALEAEADALAAAQAPSDWENRVHALRQQGVQLQSRSGPRQARADAVRRELDAAFAALGALRPEQPAPAEEQARVRAEAVRAAVLGSPELPALTERYRLLRANDGWEDVAYAEYVANVTGARGGADEARATLKQMRGQDPTFVRLYILDARLALQARDPASARASLESALSLNPEHTLARLLLERALRDTPPEPQEAEVPEAGDPTPTP
jgi:predicted Zn-dependent protease